MSDPNDLAAFLDLGWQRLTRGVADRRAAARHPVFATVSPDGLPEARTVVLRAASRSTGSVEVHTDGGSDKITSLRANPHAQLMIWDEKAKLQIRLSTTVTVHQGPEVADKWQTVPDGSRMAYGASPKPGTPIPNAHAYEKLASRDWFTVLSCRIDKIELMQLVEPHRRAVFQASDAWQGEWRVP
ncbi:pyridoxamine 5'-phosphate oxidase family protein [Marivita geojedonensis]|uniref:Pyridoxamine 5'-phosphate oxidase n=1 Tax=Marivita geojedonensis TaxID=1123756 RepID=A0A1X4NIZ8_9RHOB|nr:pyridoxamine 5'-phosphate oxidase family protein [Marivita geojedonensis]OSQ48987.1 pyridoxamine 5'-phosphate oxidase [Marivita geojedonensis]PRY75319.1 pyridoxamine 5'-phosphate oxidase-like protein [Marivita geojedonensis]